MRMCRLLPLGFPRFNLSILALSTANLHEQAFFFNSWWASPGWIQGGRRENRPYIAPGMFDFTALITESLGRFQNLQILIVAFGVVGVKAMLQAWGLVAQGLKDRLAQ
jgi:hypothetical protein